MTHRLAELCEIETEHERHFQSKCAYILHKLALTLPEQVINNQITSVKEDLIYNVPGVILHNTSILCTRLNFYSIAQKWEY